MVLPEEESFSNPNPDGDVRKASRLTLNELKKRYLYTDLERKLFNIGASVREFKRQARDMEVKSLNSKRKCRRLLMCLHHAEAWSTAKRALEADRYALLFNIASERLKSIIKIFKSVDEMEPLMLRMLNELDFAVRESDPERTRQLISILEEEFDLGFEETYSPDQGPPTEEDVYKYMTRLQEEIQILESLKVENGPVDKPSSDTSMMCHSIPVQDSSKLKTKEILKPSGSKYQQNVTEVMKYAFNTTKKNKQ